MFPSNIWSWRWKDEIVKEPEIWEAETPEKFWESVGGHSWSLFQFFTPTHGKSRHCDFSWLSSILQVYVCFEGKKKKVESWFSCGKPLFYPFYPFLHFLSTQQSHFNHQNGTKDILGKITNVFFFIHLSLPFHVIPWPYLVGFGIYLKMKKWKPCLKEI